MDPRDFLHFIYRRFLAVVLITTIGLGLGLGYTFSYDKGTRNGLIFITLGMEIPEGIPASYMITSDGHNVVDHFAETVQGWFLNPAMDERIDDLAGADASVSVRKQEKQNLLVEVTVEKNDNAQVATEAVLEILKEDVISYDGITNTDFVVALSSMTFSETAPNYLMNGAVGGLLGFLFVILFFLLVDYLLRRVSFPSQVERLVGAAPLHAPRHDEVIVVELGRTTEHDLKRILSEKGGPFDYILK